MPSIRPGGCWIGGRSFPAGTALHLYHGYLGARTLTLRGGLSCYDPWFYAGYPKTPVFDGGSRPAELALTLGRGRYQPGIYKVGLALFCLSVPGLTYFAARSVGLTRLTSLVAGLLGLVLWWGKPVRDSLEAGDVDLLLASLMLLLQAALLLRYDQRADLTSVFGLFAAGFLGWLASPLAQALLLPLFLGYYLSVGHRHQLLWHATLVGTWLAAVGANLFWLLDWVDYWWIRVPTCGECSGEMGWQPLDVVLTAGLLLCAVFGLVLWNRGRYRPVARVLGLGTGSLLALGLLGCSWEPLVRLGSAPLLLPGILMAVPAAAHGLGVLVRLLHARLGLTGAVLTAGSVVGLAWLLAPAELAAGAVRLVRTPALQIGLRPEQEQLVQTLIRQTTQQARILWEDRRTARTESQWTVLLPLLTQRSFVGGLDSQVNIEHATGGLIDQALAGRPVRGWSDSQLAEYCDKYNVGWIVAWSPPVVERLRSWSGAELLETLPRQGEPGQLFRVRRTHTYALVGSAQVVHADAQRIILADVLPYKADGRTGRVVLSLHYQTGMRVSPGRIQLEQDRTSPDEIPFVRLLLDDPASRVTITWEKR